MRISKPGIDLLKRFEGCSLSAYRCPVNVLTIGAGHTKDVKEDQTITMEQAEDLLRSDVKMFEAVVNRHVKVPLTENEFDALVCLVFNIGETNFRRSTLLRRLNEGKRAEAADQFLRWCKGRLGGGKRVVIPGLLRRREAERKLFLTH